MRLNGRAKVPFKNNTSLKYRTADCPPFWTSCDARISGIFATRTTDLSKTP